MSAGDEKTTFNYDDFYKYLENTVKKEPIDPDEIPFEPSSPPPDRRSPVNDTNDNPSTSGYQSRDPRVKSALFNPAALAKRESFLNGSLKADEVIRSSAKVDLNTQPKQIRDIRIQAEEIHKTLSSKQSSLYSRSAQVPVGRTRDNRSPVISNNHSALFLHQATSDNIRDTFEARRTRNISIPTQQLATLVGADLDSISQRVEDSNRVSQTVFSYNSKTTSSQTDPVAVNDGEARTSNQKRKFATVATQTTKNDGVFTIWNVADLTNIQRQALLEFKKVMNIQDEKTTNGILERIEHRQASKAFNNNNRHQRDNNLKWNSFDRESSRAGSSRNRSIDQYSNPPAPDRSNPKRPRYSYGRPE